MEKANVIDEVVVKLKKSVLVAMATRTSIFAFRDENLYNIMDSVSFQNSVSIKEDHYN